MSENLSKLFGSVAKLKAIKLFVFNPEQAFDAPLIAQKIKESPSRSRSELNVLEKAKLIKRRVFYKTEIRKIRKHKVVKKVKTNGWVLNKSFEFLVPLQQFLIKVNHLNPREIARKLGKGGNLKLLVLSGVFIQDPESRVDMLVVGDHLKRGMVEGAVRAIESEMGRELRYAVFDTPDFLYRLGLYDKLIRDILDYPHETIINKIGDLEK